MSDEIGLEKFRKLSITALVTGILTYSYLYLIPQLIGFLVLTLRNYIQNEITITCIVGAVVFIIMGLPICFLQSKNVPNFSRKLYHLMQKN